MAQVLSYISLTDRFALSLVPDGCSGYEFNQLLNSYAEDQSFDR